jgi:prevent-host-death family protein
MRLVRSGSVQHALMEAPRIEEVSVRDLSRHTSRILTDVRDHHRLIVTRHGHPIAVLLSIDDCIEMLLLRGKTITHRVERVEERRALLERLLGSEIHERVRARQTRRIERMQLPSPTDRAR